MTETVNVNGMELEVHNYKCVFVPVGRDTLEVLQNEDISDTVTVYDGEYLQAVLEENTIDDKDDIEDIKAVIELFEQGKINMATLGNV